MEFRSMLFLLPLGFALAACTNHEPVADGDDGYDRATVPTDATAAGETPAGEVTGGTAPTATGAPRPTGATGQGPAVAGGPNAAEAETVAIEATGQDASDSAAADVAGAEAATRDDNSNQYERAPVASDAVEAGYNDDDKDGGD